jgi:hypothetical protein
LPCAKITQSWSKIYFPAKRTSFSLSLEIGNQWTKRRPKREHRGRLDRSEIAPFYPHKNKRTFFTKIPGNVTQRKRGRLTILLPRCRGRDWFVALALSFPTLLLAFFFSWLCTKLVSSSFMIIKGNDLIENSHLAEGDLAPTLTSHPTSWSVLLFSVRAAIRGRTT